MFFLYRLSQESCSAALCLYIIVKALQKSPKLMLNFTLHSAWQLQSPSFALEYTVSILSNS